MPKPPQQPGLPIGDRPTERVAARRDPEPTQGPGSAAGELGDSATRAAFVAGAPIHDGKAITPPAEESVPAAPGVEPAPTPPHAPPPASDSSTPASAAPRPAAEDGPGPVNNQGQRTPVSFNPQNADEMWRYAQMLARSTLLPRAFYEKDERGKPTGIARIADVHFVLMKGQALGLHPQVSIGNINVIDGKAEIGASLMVALCLRSGLCEYFELVKSDERSATFATKRVGGRREIEFAYTIEEAEQMGLPDRGKTEWARENNQWRKQPRTMLRRRCQSMLAREVFPDICMGLYDHDELMEMRERELALGIDPDRVIAMNGIAAAQVGELTEGAGPGPIARMAAQPADPLKARLAARRAQAMETVQIGPRLCSQCQSPLDARDEDPCIACRTEPTPPTR